MKTRFTRAILSFAAIATLALLGCATPDATTARNTESYQDREYVTGSMLARHHNTANSNVQVADPAAVAQAAQQMNAATMHVPGGR